MLTISIVGLAFGNIIPCQRLAATTAIIPPLPKIEYLDHLQQPSTAEQAEQTVMISPTDGKPFKTTLIPEIQEGLDQFIYNRFSPIAAVVLVDVKTGHILALSQGKPPHEWGASEHTAVYNKFPAASLFKTVVSAAAFEILDFDENKPIGLVGGCAHVRPNGRWLLDKLSGRFNRMDLYRAYGLSCNSFFAKLAVNYLGLSNIIKFAEKFGWHAQAKFADFLVPQSPINAPKLLSSSIHSVGRFAAGFGAVGISAIHAAWMMTLIARNGSPIPLQLYQEQDKSPTQFLVLQNKLQLNQQPIASLTKPSSKDRDHVEPVFSLKTAKKLRKIMKATIRGGTASSAFRRRPYRSLRYIAGGKTGTLDGHAPEGVTTWFAGIMPIDEEKEPEVVVASVVILDDLWHIRAPNLAAEALRLYARYKKKQQKMLSSLSNTTKSSTR